MSLAFTLGTNKLTSVVELILPSVTQFELIFGLTRLLLLWQLLFCRKTVIAFSLESSIILRTLQFKLFLLKARKLITLVNAMTLNEKLHLLEPEFINIARIYRKFLGDRRWMR